MKKKIGEKRALEEIEKALKAPRKEQKIRITTMLDGDVLDELKRQAKKQGIGYQTLINFYLRTLVLETDMEEVKELVSSAVKLLAMGKIGQEVRESFNKSNSKKRA
jgi:uncharacterized protein (DUF4415 family)